MVIRSAYSLLKSGLQSHSQAEVATALQVFFNLGTLKDVVRGIVQEYVASFEAAIRAATDSRQLGGLVSQGPGKAQTRQGAAVKVQDVLWQQLEECMALLQTSALAVWHLQRVLLKKRDPLTLVALADAVKVFLSLLRLSYYGQYDKKYSVHAKMRRAYLFASPRSCCRVRRTREREIPMCSC
jgi:conserved oligomeric Golgi complex subunit 5